MSLPISGGGLNRPPTHDEIDLGRLAKLGLELEDIAEDGTLQPEAIEELAQTLGVDESNLYAAAALVTDFQVARSAEVQVLVCAGGCQKWGALELLDELVQLRRDRLDAGQPGFDVAARRCLDMCQHAPAAAIQTPAGTAKLPRATAAELTSQLTQSLDSE